VRTTRAPAVLLSVLGIVLTTGTGGADATIAGPAEPPKITLPHQQLPVTRTPDQSMTPLEPPTTGQATEQPKAPTRDLPAIGVSPAAGATVEPPLSSAAVSFGENYFGQLGAFYKDRYELSPVPVEGLANIREVAGSVSFNLALLADGTVASWGGNGHGQLGDGKKKPSWEDGVGHVIVKEEVPVTHEIGGPLHGVKAIAAANEHAIALMSDRTVMTWGNDEYGQLGNGTQGFERQINVNERLPKAVPGLQNIQAVSAGGGSDYALTNEGTVRAWGNNTEGQLGLGRPGPDHCETAVAHFPRYELCSERPLPVMWTNPVNGKNEELKEVKALFAGEFVAYALLRSGRLVSWGANHDGQLGTGADTWRGNEFPPTEVRRPDGKPLSGIAEVAAGNAFALVRLESGEVLGWGSTKQGDLAGLPGEECRHELNQRKRPSSEGLPREPRPCVKLATPIPALERLHPQALSAGSRYGLAVAAGSVYSWGNDERGQLGRGKVPSARFTEGVRTAKEAGNPNPVKVRGFGAASRVLAAGTHSVVLLRSGVAPPAALVTAVPEALSVDLSWRPETVTGREAIVGERLLYRVSERSGEPEPAEQGKSEVEEGPPVSLSSEPAYLTFAGERLEDQQLFAGARLTVEPGGWSGARPIVFTYQWLRCNGEGEACTEIAGARHPGYGLTAADVGSTVRAVVSATGAEAPSSSVLTEATEPIAAALEGESMRNAATSVKLTGSALSFTINRTVEKLPWPGRENRFHEIFKPLQAVPYEVKFTASKRSRVMVLTPLPEGARPG
jgi:alpha-tubulin suppressor-like RCC1 family protein